MGFACKERAAKDFAGLFSCGPLIAVVDNRFSADCRQVVQKLAAVVSGNLEQLLILRFAQGRSVVFERIS